MYGPVRHSLGIPLVPRKQDVEHRAARGHFPEQLELVHLAAEPRLRIQPTVRRADAHQNGRVAALGVAQSRWSCRAYATDMASPDGASASTFARSSVHRSRASRIAARTSPRNATP